MRNNRGFTLVEVVVTLVVSLTFVLAIIQLQAQVSRLSIIQQQRSRADNLAYNNLRKYADGSAPKWYKCDGSPQMSLIDTTENVDNLPPPVVQKVVASAPYGCGGSAGGIGMPIRIESTVMYGKNQEKVVHVLYAAY